MKNKDCSRIQTGRIDCGFSRLMAPCEKYIILLNGSVSGPVALYFPTFNDSDENEKWVYSDTAYFDFRLQFLVLQRS